MFLYRFVRRRHLLQILVHSITFEQRFGILSFLAGLLALTYILPDSMLVDFRRDLDLEFPRSIWNLLYLSQKWSHCHGSKNKYIDWNLGLKCDHRIWPWPWPWPWIFKVKYGICYTSAKNGPIATKRKANISIEPKASNATIRFDLGHDFDLWIFKVKCDLDLWPHTWPWPWIAVISEWEDRLTLDTGGGSRSFITMAVTIWWLRSGVRICQIVTGVTSDVGVPLTHRVFTNNGNYEVDAIFKSFNS